MKFGHDGKVRKKNTEERGEAVGGAGGYEAVEEARCGQVRPSGGS